MILGTIVNAAAIAGGGIAGLLLGKFSSKKKPHGGHRSDGIMKVLGLAILVLGIQMTREPHDYFPVVLCLVLGTFLGETARLEEHLGTVGEKLKKIISSSSDNFANAFVTGTIIYCVGATAILGPLRESLGGDPSLLYVKSILDGVISFILAGTMGVGIIFSAAPVFIYQGLIAVGASQLSFLTENPVYLNGISVTGGVLIIGIGLNMALNSQLRIGNMLPALFLVPLYDFIKIHFLM